MEQNFKYYNLNNFQNLQRLICLAKENVFEKDEIFDLTFLALLSNESIFLLGKPGIAKSLIARRLKYCFKNSVNFEYLMNKFSTPDEIFGPISIKAFEKEEYARNIKNYLPSANIVFLDEIWKSSSAVLNSLLMIINEKIYKNGKKEIKVPLYLLMAASNELPEKNEGLDALYDRFTIRYIAEGILKNKNFQRMITNSVPVEISVEDNLKITEENYYHWLLEIKKVKVNKFLVSFLMKLRARLNHELSLLYISDRRWKKITLIILASAYFNNRTEPSIIDCLVIPFCLWNDYEEEVKIKKIFRDFFIENIQLELYFKALKYQKKIKKIIAVINKLKFNIDYKNFKIYKIKNNVNSKFFKIYSSLNKENYLLISKDDFQSLRKQANVFLKIPFLRKSRHNQYHKVYLRVKLNDNLQLKIKNHLNLFFIEQKHDDQFFNKPYLLLVKKINLLKEKIVSILMQKKDIVNYLKNQNCLFLNNYKNSLLNFYQKQHSISLKNEQKK